MKENLNQEILDLRIFENPINPIDLIKSITSSDLNVENDPFYIVDLEDICNKHINWITKLPRVEPHYAVKCNTDSIILKLLAFLGAGFDCASKNEIQTILDLGVAPHRIIFANPCKQASFIKYANKVGVNLMTFDNENELYKIKQHHPNAKCVLRIITDDKDAICRFSMKFGADMDSSLKLIELAYKLNLDLCGVSFHVGSGQMSPEAFSESIQNARKLFDYAREKFDIRMHLLDLGGGFPGSSDSNDLFDLISRQINKSLDQFFPAEEFENLNSLNDEECKLKIIAEPGRYYACSAFTLCVNIIAKRVMNQSEQQKSQDGHDLEQKFLQPNPHPSLTIQTANKTRCIESVSCIDQNKSIMYYINDGVYASFNCLFYDHSECFPILLKDNVDDAVFYKSSIWGPTCDGLDLVCKEIYVPELETNEFMVFKDMGAYTISGAVAFNGIPLPKSIYTVSTSWKTIEAAFSNNLEEMIPFANNTSCHASAGIKFPKSLNETSEACKIGAKEIKTNYVTGSSIKSTSINEIHEEMNISENKKVDCAITC
ncbi:ornithine decarboxylase [Brachionus plicatilis]|uniref:ornithine decarboxylase n=1 Tax=Brachionus plicatilis TaxID=10195 RepID=A0A3M7T092_BRAPC|nr:ornithine decarboxylase [Brachionus plicatilis]